MTDFWFLVPIITVFAVFGAIVLIVRYVTEYRAATRRIDSEGGGMYRRLAEETVASHRVLLEEIRAMNKTLQEIERLLREV